MEQPHIPDRRDHRTGRLVGWSPLLLIIVLAGIGLWPNPNPIGPGLLFFFSFWPAVVCMALGIFQVWRGAALRSENPALVGFIWRWAVGRQHRPQHAGIILPRSIVPLPRWRFCMPNSPIRRLAMSAAFALGMAAAWTFAHAAEPQALLEGFMRDVQGLSGDFRQRVLDPDGRVEEDSQGRIALAVPRQFRWEYETPFPQLIVADGSRVWIFDPDLEQVQVRPQDAEEQRSPLSALTDPDELERQFIVADGGQSEGLDWVTLEPRDADAGFSSGRLGFAEGQLLRMDMTDSLGQRTRIEFSGWKRNSAFAPDTFRFVPPPGVDVIGDAGEVEVEAATQAFPLED